MTGARPGLPARDLLAVDTRTFAVTTIETDAPAPHSDGTGGGEWRVVGLLALIAAAALTAVLLLRRRRRGRGVPLRSAGAG